MEDPASGLGSLFSLSREAVIAVHNGTIIFMNPAAAEKAGGDSTGKPASLLLPEHILNTQAGMFVSSAVIAGKRTSVSASLLNGVRVYMLNFDPVEPKGDIETSIITQIRILLSNIKLANDRLAAFTETYGDAKLAQCTSVIEHSNNQLRRLIQNISTACAIDRGDIPWFPVATDVRELCAKIVEAAAFFGEKRRISVVFDCSLKSCDAVVDRELIEQLLLNLISNSLLHVSEGGRVRITLMRSGTRLVISVDDNGSGIPPQVLSTVFSRWRERKTLAESASGAGIGLGVARGIAERHGGALVIESKEGKGTAVRVMLPTDNEPTARFGSSETSYSFDTVDPVLIQLSTWLSSSEYGQEMND